ncbi:MAG: hypothetical protein ACRCV9_03040 [Burkholderiaceae bacterium]
MLTDEEIDALWLGERLSLPQLVTRRVLAAKVAREVLERAAQVVEAEHVGESVHDVCDGDADAAYNQALQHAATAIRAKI